MPVRFLEMSNSFAYFHFLFSMWHSSPIVIWLLSIARTGALSWTIACSLSIPSLLSVSLSLFPLFSLSRSLCDLMGRKLNMKWSSFDCCWSTPHLHSYEKKRERENKGKREHEIVHESAPVLAIDNSQMTIGEMCHIENKNRKLAKLFDISRNRTGILQNCNRQCYPLGYECFEDCPDEDEQSRRAFSLINQSIKSARNWTPRQKISTWSRFSSSRRVDWY